MKPAHPIQAAIFDMDGVLTDSEPLINKAAIQMFRELGIQVQPDDFLPFVGAGEDRYLGGVAQLHGVSLDLPSAKHRTYQIYLQLVPTELKAFTGAQHLVRNAQKNGLKIAVASSADRIKVEANLNQIGLPPHEWDVVISGEEVVAKKPAPDIFLAAAQRLQLAPEQCCVVEDAVNGVAAAKSAGMRCVAVAQTFPASALQKADLVKPTLAAVSVADLCARHEEATHGNTTPVDPRI